MEQKKGMVSGKLNGTRSLVTYLEAIDEPDEVEQFLLAFASLKFEPKDNNPIIYIADDQDFLECLKSIEKSNSISLYPTAHFSRLYVTTDDRVTYVIRLNAISITLINTFISKETPAKYGLNSFSFIKWCVERGIDIRNIYDIPTYIKILTNEVNPFESVESYVKKYTDYEMQDDDETNNVVISNFIYDFGKFLDQYVAAFDLTTVCRLINENSYFEGNSFDNMGTCEIKVSYQNLAQGILTIADKKRKEFQKRAYIKSPLGRIAIKFKREIKDLIQEIYLEDISLTVLNELYNNNIPVTLEADNTYKITCKYKNFNSVISLVNAVFNDVFYSIFEQSAEFKIECSIKS